MKLTLTERCSLTATRETRFVSTEDGQVQDHDGQTSLA